MLVTPGSERVNHGRGKVVLEINKFWFFKRGGGG